MSIRPKKIVIIEDDPAYSVPYKDYFVDQGFDVLHARTGKRGVKLIEQHQPDVVLLALLVQQMDGYDVLHHIKTRDHIKHVPVIVLSHLSHADDVERSRSLGAHDHCVKEHHEPATIHDKIYFMMNES